MQTAGAQIPAPGVTVLQASMVAALLLLPGCVLPGLHAHDGPGLHEALLGPEAPHLVQVHVRAVPPLHPDPSALEELRRTLEQVTGKETELRGVHPMAPPQIPQRTRHDVTHLHLRHAAPAPGTAQDAVHLHVLYAPGVLASGELHLAGTFVREHGLLVVFPEAFAHVEHVVDGQRISAAAEVERRILLHEAGHALGLVDRGVPMQTERLHPHHPGHSNDPASVLYPRVAVGPGNLLSGPAQVGFTEEDLADLAAYRAHLHERQREAETPRPHGRDAASQP